MEEEDEEVVGCCLVSKQHACVSQGQKKKEEEKQEEKGQKKKKKKKKKKTKKKKTKKKKKKKKNGSPVLTDDIVRDIAQYQITTLVSSEAFFTSLLGIAILVCNLKDGELTLFRSSAVNIMRRGRLLDLALLLVLVVWPRESTAAAAVSDSPVLPPVDVIDTVATESFKAVASNDSVDVSHSTDNNKITDAKQSIDIHEFADASEFTAESNAIASLRPTGQAGQANCRPVCSRKLAAESSRPVPSQVTNAMQAAELPPELGGNTDSSTNDLSAVVSNTEEPADGAMPSGHVTIMGSQAASADGVTNFARNTVIHGTLLDSSNVTSVDRNSSSPALVSLVSSNPNPASAIRSPRQVDSITQSTTAATRYSGDNYAGGWQPDYATGFIPQTYPDYGGWDYNGSHPEEYGSFMPPTLPPVSSSTDWGTAALGMLSLFQDLCELDHTCDGTEWNALPTAHVQPCSECPLCFCDDECYDSNTCCMDRIINDFGQVVQTPHCYNRYFTDVKYGEYFLMVDDCPDTWQDQSVSSRCANASTSDLHGQWPMESSVTGSVYRNEHCARCHGEDEATLERWDLQVSCSKVTRLQNTSHLQDLVQEIRNTPGCHLAFEPPRYSRFCCSSFSFLPSFNTAIHSFPVHFFFMCTH